MAERTKVKMIEVDSSNLAAIGFMEEDNAIIVNFQSGASYKYKNCTKEEFELGVNSPNVSQWFNTVVRTKPFKRI